MAWIITFLGLINYFQEKVSFVLYFFLVVILGVCWIFLYYASKNVALCIVIVIVSESVSEWCDCCSCLQNLGGMGWGAELFFHPVVDVFLNTMFPSDWDWHGIEQQ